MATFSKLLIPQPLILGSPRIDLAESLHVVGELPVG
jgi:hypothetical protein